MPSQPRHRATTASSSAAATTAWSARPPWRAAAARCWCWRRMPQVGGAAVTREFAPGFPVSAGAHLLHLMPAELIARSATRIARPGVGGAGPADHGAARRCALPLDAESGAGDRRIAADAAALRGLLGAHAPLRARRWRRCSCKVPPRLGTDGLGGPLGAAAPRLADPQARAARHARAAAHRRHECLRPAGGAFRIAALKGALGFDAVLGTNFGPRSPGTVLTLLYRLAAEAARRQRRCRNRRAAWARCATRSPRRRPRPAP